MGIFTNLQLNGYRRKTVKWCCHILMVLSHINGAVTYKRIKVTDTERTENLQKNVIW